MSLSDVSDLTELSSDEDDVSPSKTTRSKASKKNTREYKISGVLRPPRTTSYTAKSLYDQIIDNVIDLDPEYQRDVVWSEVKQSGLIDSMLRNYYIPPIIFAVSTADDGSELRTCIDGKQRLTSIQRFVDGQIPHKDSFTNEKLWYKASAANANARRKILPKHLMTQFANKQIVCVEYNDISGDQEREVFQRVQLGVALTPAERMQAFVGPWPTVIREIQSQVLGEDGFQGYLDWGHARGRDFQCLASIGYLIENHPKPTVPAAPTLEKWLLKNDPVSPKLREDLLDTFRVFLVLARDQKYCASLNKPTRVSPIEFVMIGVLIYLFRDRLSLTQLSSAVEQMRKDVRDAHRDIRANGRITKHMLLFMSKRLKISDLQSDGKGDKPAAGKPAKGKKRKRPAVYDGDSDVDADDDDDEEKEYKLSRKGTVIKAAPAVSSTSKLSSKPSKSTSQKKPSKSNPVATKLSAGSKQTRALLDSRPPGERTSTVPVVAKVPPPTAVERTPAKAPPPTSVERTSEVSVMAKALPPTPAERASKVPVTAKAPPPTLASLATLTKPSPPSTQSPSTQSPSLQPPSVQSNTRPPPAPIVNVAQLSPVVKSEPRVTSLHPSPASPPSSIPVADRLDPIRAAKKAIWSNSGSQVQSPAVPYAEHHGPASKLDVNGSILRDLRHPGPSLPAATVPPQQNLIPLPNSMGQQLQINPSDVEALLRAHGLMTPQVPVASPAALSGHTMATVQLGLNIVNGVGTSVPGSPAISPLQPMHSASVNGAGLAGQSVRTSHYPPIPSQAPLYNPESRLSNGTHPAPRHSIPPPPPSAAPAPINTAPRDDSRTNQPQPHSASSNGSFKDDRRYSDYERRDYSRGGPYEKDYRRHGSGGRRASSGYDNYRDRGRDSSWDTRRTSYRRI